jgi:hypothetical protein
MWLRSSFSTAAETPTAEEEPLLGVGKYKTSTGIVSENVAVIEKIYFGEIRIVAQIFFSPYTLIFAHLYHI